MVFYDAREFSGVELLDSLKMHRNTVRYPLGRSLAQSAQASIACLSYLKSSAPRDGSVVPHWERPSHQSRRSTPRSRENYPPLNRARSGAKGSTG